MPYFKVERLMLTPLLLFFWRLSAAARLRFVLSRFSNQPRSLVVFSAALGYFLAGTAIWSLTPATWTLSLPQPRRVNGRADLWPSC